MCGADEDSHRALWSFLINLWLINSGLTNYSVKYVGRSGCLLIKPWTCWRTEWISSISDLYTFPDIRFIVLMLHALLPQQSAATHRHDNVNYECHDRSDDDVHFDMIPEHDARQITRCFPERDRCVAQIFRFIHQQLQPLAACRYVFCGQIVKWVKWCRFNRQSTSIERNALCPYQYSSP